MCDPVVIEALKKLKPHYREVLVLRDIDGSSYQQIASHLGKLEADTRTHAVAIALREAIID